jgi:hypothetical protein
MAQFDWGTAEVEEATLTVELSDVPGESSERIPQVVGQLTETFRGVAG